MSNSIALIVDNKQYCKVMALTVDSNIYATAGSFDAELHPSYYTQINKGDRCRITIDGVTVMDGIIDKVGMRGSKTQLIMYITGRDLMGLVVDSCIEEFATLKNKKLIDVAEKYLNKIDYIKHCNIMFVDGSESLDVDQEYVQPVPGMTVFDLLSGIAAARGVHFYMRPDGEIVFGKPKGFGNHTFFIYRTNDRNVNYTDFDISDDISQRYSRVTVLGQDESTPTTAATALNKSSTVQDDTFPPFSKPLVVETNTAAKTVRQQARMIIEQQRFRGWAVQYTVGGFAQRGSVWAPDTVCAVDDVRIGLREECLVYGRSFIYRKGEMSTRVILGKMGLV